MLALIDRVAAQGTRLGAAKCHQIQGDIWELIHGSIRILFAHDGDRLILCTGGFVKKSQKTPKPEIDKAKQVLKNFRKARKENRLEWIQDNQGSE
ncbi:MAG: type II toxin-antitoxin system RelE/ParE family toxin [Wenzhouxiangella sp.]